MNASTTLEHRQLKYEEIYSMLADGRLQIPKFQRTYVWDRKSTAELIDSMIKGYPVGSFVFWKTNEDVASHRKIGSLEFGKKPPAGEFREYILDGQQRITCIILAFQGEVFTNEKGTKQNYSPIYINLDDSEDNDDDIVTYKRNKESKNSISVVDLMQMRKDYRSYQQNDIYLFDRISKYKRNLEEYKFPIIYLDRVDTSDAIKSFNLMNTKGKPLTLFEIMVSMTFKEGKFDLAEEYKKFMAEKEMADYKKAEKQFQKIVLQVVSVLIKQSYSKNDTLTLPKDEFIDIWPKATKAIKDTVEHFKKRYGIVASYLLPYPLLVVLFSYYFYKQEEQGLKPSEDVRRRMEDLFWRISLGERYTSSANTKFDKDLKRVDKIIEGNLPEYDWDVPRDPSDIIDKGEFKLSGSYVKAILAILVSKKPRNFNNNDEVKISNENLKAKGNKNFHHFFPKAHMDAVAPSIANRHVNNIANITIIDAALNRRLSDQDPTVYMKEFVRNNRKIKETMETHMIDLGDEQTDPFGIFEGGKDGYEKFLEARARLILREIRKRIILTESEKSELEANEQRRQAAASY